MNVWLCFRVAARDKGTLHSLGITHIVNAAHGASDAAPGDRFYVKTGPQFYRDMRVDYYGVEADDAIEFILSPFFYPTARYIRAALAMGGKSVIGCVIAALPSWIALDCTLNVNCPLPRTSVCPLPDGCESLCNSGAGFPDDRGGLDAAGGGRCR